MNLFTLQAMAAKSNCNRVLFLRSMPWLSDSMRANHFAHRCLHPQHGLHTACGNPYSPYTGDAGMLPGTMPHQLLRWQHACQFLPDIASSLYKQNTSPDQNAPVSFPCFHWVIGQLEIISSPTGSSRITISYGSSFLFVTTSHCWWNTVSSTLKLS